MSLLVWLPLNGDLRNLGLHGESIFTTSNADSNNNGKIGKCYSFNGTNSYLIADFTPGTIIPKEMSFCCWVKLNEIGRSQTLFSSRTRVGAGLSFFIMSSNKLRFDNGNDQNSATYLTTFNYVFATNIWYHIAVIQTNALRKLYINGVLLQTISKASANLGNNTAIKGTIGASGNANDATGNWLDGYLNDVRIYDHALSNKEVEEISKGLILHYPLHKTTFLNQIENLIVNSTFTYPDETIITIAHETNNYTYINMGTLALNIGNQICTYSCYIKNNSDVTVEPRIRGVKSDGTSSSYARGVILQPGELGWVTVTLDMTNTEYYSPTSLVYLRFYFNKRRNESEGNMTILYAQLEIGNERTSWVSSGQSSLSGIVYDSSGYNNDGTIISPLSTVADTTRYNLATHFSATNQKVKIDNLTTVGFGNSYSFAWWEKINSVDSMHWGFANGIRLNGMYKGRLWNTSDSSDNPLYIPGTTTQVTIPSVNVWHHWVMTGDGTKCKVYQDGELWAEAKTYKGISGTTIYLNGWNETTIYSSDNASMSDFRIYATALTETQVKELYNTSVTIDNLGSVFARELVE